MKSQGEIEAAVSDGISKFHQEFIGRGPKEIRAHLLGTLLVVRLSGALSTAECKLFLPQSANMDGRPEGATAMQSSLGDGQAIGNGNGRSLLKQVRGHMVALGRNRLAAIIHDATGVELVSVHHDISTVTGEEVLVFSLGASPTYREKRFSKTV